MQVSEGQQVQIVQAAAAQGQAQTAQAQGQTMQVMQQIITNTGEIQQIPVRDEKRTDGKETCCVSHFFKCIYYLFICSFHTCKQQREKKYVNRQ